MTEWSERLFAFRNGARAERRNAAGSAGRQTDNSPFYSGTAEREAGKLRKEGPAESVGPIPGARCGERMQGQNRKKAGLKQRPRFPGLLLRGAERRQDRNGAEWSLADARGREAESRECGLKRGSSGTGFASAGACAQGGRRSGSRD